MARDVRNVAASVRARLQGVAMSRLFAFEGATLAAAIHATFARRVTAVPWEHPPSLTVAFSEDPRKVQQWRSFLAREPLVIADSGPTRSPIPAQADH